MTRQPMTSTRAIVTLLALSCSAASDQPTAASLTRDLQRLTLDPQQTYRIRDLSLHRGGVSFYFNEGIMSFALPVAGRRVAAVFTSVGVDAGDAEVLIVPPQQAERASLASFTNTANLDEHITSAVLFFSDNTWDEILTQIGQSTIRKAPELAAELNTQADPILQGASQEIQTRIIASALDEHPSDHGFVYATIIGRTLGIFDLLYEPDSFEPITVGQLSKDKMGPVHFQPWMAYRPRQAPAYQTPRVAISNYRIDTTVNPDLSISAKAEFDYLAPPNCGRVVSLDLSRRMKIQSASIEGVPVETLGNYDEAVNASDLDGQFLLISSEALVKDRQYRIQVRYSGNVIRQVADSSYFVSERNLWYPHTEPMSTTFDLAFQCPERFEIVSTGEPISDRIENGERQVHRKTLVPEQLAGFNVGEYKAQSLESRPYLIQGYGDLSAPSDLNAIPQESAKILQNFTRRWVSLPIHTLALTPIPGKFGQGFPGLIYLARMAYVPEKDRPLDLQSPREHVFFSQVLLPHELAHQWWGNMITSADYRTDWLMEAMANYSALQYIEETEGKPAMDSILEQYRADLDRTIDGKRIASLGPVNFGYRLIETSGALSWQIIVYEKGTWVLHMLRRRLGDKNFRNLQLSLLNKYSGKPISNEEFRQLAGAFIPAGQPDRTLLTFFDAWVYGTGVPVLKISRAGKTVDLSGVDEDFSADLPLICKTKNGVEQERWMRLVTGSNSVSSPQGESSCRLPMPDNFLYSIQ